MSMGRKVNIYGAMVYVHGELLLCFSIFQGNFDITMPCYFL